MHEGQEVTVVLVDDHELFARGLEAVLPELSGGRLKVVGTTADASAAAQLVRREQPHLALVDLLMPEPGGLRAIAAVRRAAPATRVVALSGSDDEDLAAAALERGAHAYVPKSLPPDALAAPLLAVAAGWSLVPDPLLGRLQGDRGAHDLVRRLSAEDRRLWRLVAEGRTTVEVAAELHVSERTVKRMVSALLRTLRVSTRAEAATLAGQADLLSRD
ncbi:response regulator transcription factor [Quadrisphaera sp. DSM 44207]|uniref:response regulator transcription factor n=1 Tax=Quadrisphaera sp. DSM 44207 TaxID=1881057 RepID=UPI000B880C49